MYDKNKNSRYDKFKKHRKNKYKNKIKFKIKTFLVQKNDQNDENNNSNYENYYNTENLSYFDLNYQKSNDFDNTTFVKNIISNDIRCRRC